MLKNSQIKKIVLEALKEDIGSGDITTNSLIRQDKKVKAAIFSRQNAVVCGLKIAQMVFKALDKNIKFKFYYKDAKMAKKDTAIMKIEGKARAILTGERVALNFLSHLSGIATQTSIFVNKIKPYKIKIFDTRKTIPGMRPLEKYAVCCGGGYNHRMGLWDMVLIKDNHLEIINPKSEIPALPAGRRNPKQIPNSKFQISKLKEIIAGIRKKIPKGTKIEVEAKNLKEFKAALLAKPDIIMLDNMNLKSIKRAVKLNKGISRPKIEVSGNINLSNVRKVAQTGVDIISIGSLTHSVKAIDMALEIK